jgi:PST family polysaccharide transporter
MRTETSTLNQRAESALKWNYMGVAVRSLSSLFLGVILARLLGPKPFGLVAVAGIIIGFGNLLADFGFSAAIVQRESLSEEDIRFVFTYQILSGVTLAIACFCSAGAIASIFHSQEVKAVIRVLSLTFPLQAFGQTASNLLRRKLAFRGLQIAQITSYIVYMGIGIPLAATGFGVWALVLAQLVQLFLNSVIIFSLAPHSLVPLLRINSSVLSFGFKVICCNIANWLIGNLDNAFVGRVFGVVPLGLYNRSFQLANAPIAAVVPTLQSVLFAVFSRVQNRDDVLRRAYLGCVAVLAVGMIPLFMSAAVVPSTIIIALYGRAWAGSVPLFVPLCLAMSFSALLSLAGSILWSVGKVGRDLKVQVITAAIAVVMFAATSRFSVAWLAWGVLLVYILRFLGVTREITSYLKIRWISVWITLRGGVALGLLTAVFVWISDGVMIQSGLPVIMRLILDMTVVCLLTVVALWIAPDAVLGPYAGFLLMHMKQMLPESIQRLVPRLQVTKV